jgi:hypothetical protein
MRHVMQLQGEWFVMGYEVLHWNAHVTNLKACIIERTSAYASVSVRRWLNSLPLLCYKG